MRALVQGYRWSIIGAGQYLWQHRHAGGEAQSGVTDREGEFAVNQTTGTLNPSELEVLVRRVVREELTRLLRAPVRSILEDWRQEGPNDPAEDELLLSEALAVLQRHKDQPDTWMNWEDFEAELDRAEAAGELPR